MFEIFVVGRYILYIKRHHQHRLQELEEEKEKELLVLTDLSRLRPRHAIPAGLHG